MKTEIHANLTIVMNKVFCHKRISNTFEEYQTVPDEWEFRSPPLVYLSTSPPDFNQGEYSSDELNDGVDFVVEFEEALETYSPYIFCQVEKSSGDEARSPDVAVHKREGLPQLMIAIEIF